MISTGAMPDGRRKNVRKLLKRNAVIGRKKNVNGSGEKRLKN